MFVHIPSHQGSKNDNRPYIYSDIPFHICHVHTARYYTVSNSFITQSFQLITTVAFTPALSRLGPACRLY